MVTGFHPNLSGTLVSVSQHDSQFVVSAGVSTALTLPVANLSNVGTVVDKMVTGNEQYNYDCACFMSSV